MLAAIDIHKAIFQAAVLDPDNGEITEERFNASRKASDGVDRQVARPARRGRDGGDDRAGGGSRASCRRAASRSASPIPGRPVRCRATAARQDRPARRALAGPAARPRTAARRVAAPEEIQRLRDQTRLRKALTDDHTRWAQRLHALLVHEGWPCSRGSLLTDGAGAGSRRSDCTRRPRPDRRDARRHGDASRTRST